MEGEAKQNPRAVSAIDLFSKSAAIVKKNLNTYALIYFIPAALMVATTAQSLQDTVKHPGSFSNFIGQSFFGPNSDATANSATGILFLVLIVASVIVSLMAVILNLRAAEGKVPSFSDIWAEFKHKWLKLLGLELSVALIVAAGLILLIVPGLIFLWRLSIAPYVLVGQNTGVREAISKSWEMTKGHAWAIYSIFIITVVFSALGMIPVAGQIISFVLATLYAAALPLRYLEIKKIPK